MWDEETDPGLKRGREGGVDRGSEGWRERKDQERACV